MLKRIRTDQVRLGMFIQSLEGSWLSHPFWKTRFMLENPGDLRALQNSGVQWLWIDDARGLDLAWLDGAASVGVTAGASAPELLVQGLIDRLAEAFDVMVEEVDTVRETVSFKLPRALASA